MDAERHDPTIPYETILPTANAQPSKAKKAAACVPVAIGFGFIIWTILVGGIETRLVGDESKAGHLLRVCFAAVYIFPLALGLLEGWMLSRKWHRLDSDAQTVLIAGMLICLVWMGVIAFMIARHPTEFF